MPQRRTRPAKRRRTIRPPRRYKRRIRRSALSRAILGGRVYRFARNVLTPGWVINTNITSSLNPGGMTTWSVAANTQGFATLTASLIDIGTYTEFTSLFDQYQLRAIAITITYRYNMADNLAPTSALPYIVYAKDPDDGSLATAESQLCDYQNAKRVFFMDKGRRSVRIYIRPKFNILGNDGNTNYGVQTSSKEHPWVDLAATNVHHWGVKLGIINTAPSAAAAVFDVSAKYYMSFKVVR